MMRRDEGGIANRLMDGRADRESRSRKTLHEHNDLMGALRVEAAWRVSAVATRRTAPGGFVEEETMRFRGQFDADAETLALLETEPGAGRTDDGVLEMIERQHLQHVIDDGQLLGARHVAILAQQGREFERLTNRLLLVGQVELGDEARLAVRRVGRRSSANQDLAVDGHVGRRAVRQRREQRRLAGSAGADEREQLSGLHGARNVVKQLRALGRRVDADVDVRPL